MHSQKLTAVSLVYHMYQNRKLIRIEREADEQKKPKSQRQWVNQ